ncbi:MAG: aldehyde reductase [Oricola sp.]
MSAGKSVLLTGSSGFIAKHIALQLLDAGHAVRGSVRAMNRGKEVADAVRPLLSDPSAADDRLSFVELDLLSDSGWREALQGVDVLVHTASPFPIRQPADENELIRPAVEGTLRALRAAKAAGIRRVVLTSSIAAVADGHDGDVRRTCDESDWSDVESRTITAYSKSKTLAERAAWDFVREEAPEMQLTAINPGMVLGPPLDRHFGSSMGILQRVVRSKDPALPNIGFAFVDVRDIARIHARAMDTPASIGGRHIGTAGFLWLPEVARIVAGQFPDRKIVTRRAPNALIRFLGLFDAEVRASVPMLDQRRELSNARARAVFGMDFIPADEAVRAGAKFLVDNGLV